MLTTRFDRFEALKGEDGYWYVIHFIYWVESTGKVSSVANLSSAKMTRREAEGTANKKNGQ